MSDEQLPSPRRRRRPTGARRRTLVGPARSTARRARIIIPAVILLVLIGGALFGAWNTFYKSASKVPAGKHVTVVVPTGASASEVGVLLAEKGVVANARQFRMRAEALKLAQSLKPGEYDLVTGSPYDGVIRVLAEGPAADTVTFTVPEGWGIDAIAARVEAKFGIPASEFADLARTGAKDFDYAFLKDNPTSSLEGYLFPKTYTLEESATASDIIDVMLKQYGKETASVDYSYSKSRNLNPHEVLTIASIIEREASVASDRPKVASVIYNRLKIPMRLQLDSTVQYALNGKVKLTLDDLKTQSPYNTYVVDGLPPGPICCPGIVAIKAAANPAKTKYIYYVLTHKDGRQSFATNYADFLKLKQQFKNGLK